MVRELLRYTKGMHHTVKKEDVINNLDNVLTGLNDDVIPMLDVMIKNSDLKVISESPILKSIIRGSGLNAKNNHDLLVKIKVVIANIVKSGKNLEKITSESLESVITDKTIGVKTAAILKVVSDLSTLASYIMDFNYLVLIEGKDSETDFPKIKVTQIKENVYAFSGILKAYSNNFNKIINDIDKLPSNNMYIDEGKVSMLEKIVAKFSKNIKLPNTQGFVNNPIYHFRLWLADRDVAKYEALKDKKKLIELKLLELKSRENGEENSKLRKQIEYYEGKLASTEYDIKQFDEEIE